MATRPTPLSTAPTLIQAKRMNAAAKAAKQPLTDIAAYPVLTEEVGYAPSPLARPSAAGLPVPSTGAGSSLGQVINRALSDVLGWKVKPGDAKGFVGALTQAFTLKEVDGHTESTWVPRTYTVQTDLNGQIAGAQASIFSRGKVALDQSLPLLDGLYKLDPEATDEDVAAIKAVVKSQLTELINELGFVGGPRITRVDQYFNLLLGSTTYPLPATAFAPLLQNDADQVQGTLGNLRDLLALSFTNQDFVNSVEDEANLSNFRVISDYVTSLAQSWLNNINYLNLNTTTPFFGTQLVLLSRQLSVVAESVDEVRFTLDSVFVGPAERQTVKLNFVNTGFAPIFLEDLLTWIQNFATEEGPRLIQDGGKFGVQNTFVQVATKLSDTIDQIINAQIASPPLPPGFFTQRVQLSFRDLSEQLKDLARLAKPISHVITPQPDFGLPFTVSSVAPSSLSLRTLVPNQSVMLRVRGNGFVSDVNTAVTFTANGGNTLIPTAYFQSESVLVLTMPTIPSTAVGTYDVNVSNGGNNVTPALIGALRITT